MTDNASEVLEVLSDRIEARLKKRLSPSAKEQTEILQLFLIYLSQDHKKVETMWAVFRPMAWVMGIAAATVVTLLFSGRVQLTFIP